MKLKINYFVYRQKPKNEKEERKKKIMNLRGGEGRVKERGGGRKGKGGEIV